MNPWKRRFLLETIIFRFHVSFRGGTVFIPVRGRFIFPTSIIHFFQGWLAQVFLGRLTEQTHPMQASGSPRKAKEEKVPKWQKEREKKNVASMRLLYLRGLQWKKYTKTT